MINTQCACGKSFSVPDHYAGKQVKCPACGQFAILPLEGGGVPMSTAPATTGPRTRASGIRYDADVAAARKAQLVKKDATSISLSPKVIIFIALLIIIPVLIFLAKIGPVDAMAQLKDLEGDMANWHHDVVTRTWAKVYKDWMDDPKFRPKVNSFAPDMPIMPMTMPAEIHYQGRTTEGVFKGTYYTRDRRFESEIGVFHDTKRVKVKAHMEGDTAVIDSVD